MAMIENILLMVQGLNLVLRLAWLQTVFHYNFEKVDYRVTMLFLAALEVVRRGQWNFYRWFFSSCKILMVIHVKDPNFFSLVDWLGWRMSIWIMQAILELWRQCHCLFMRWMIKIENQSNLVEELCYYMCTCLQVDNVVYIFWSSTQINVHTLLYNNGLPHWSLHSFTILSGQFQ